MNKTKSGLIQLVLATIILMSANAAETYTALISNKINNLKFYSFLNKNSFNFYFYLSCCNTYVIFVTNFIFDSFLNHYKKFKTTFKLLSKG